MRCKVDVSREKNDIVICVADALSEELRRRQACGYRAGLSKTLPFKIYSLYAACTRRAQPGSPSVMFSSNAAMSELLRGARAIVERTCKFKIATKLYSHKFGSGVALPRRMPEGGSSHVPTSNARQSRNHSLSCVQSRRHDGRPGSSARHSTYHGLDQQARGGREAPVNTIPCLRQPV